MSTQRPDEHPDLRLVEETLSGSKEASEKLIARLECIPLILHLRNNRLGTPLSEEDLKDLVQETLAVVWRKLPTYEGRSSLDSWVYSYCTHQIMNAIRSKRRQPKLAGDYALEEPSAAPTSPMSSAVEYEHVYACLGLLEQTQSTVIRLKHFSQLTFDEIAASLSMSPNTAKTLYYRGLERLRHLLEHRYRESFA